MNLLYSAGNKFSSALVLKKYISENENVLLHKKRNCNQCLYYFGKSTLFMNMYYKCSLSTYSCDI